MDTSKKNPKRFELWDSDAAMLLDRDVDINAFLRDNQDGWSAPAFMGFVNNITSLDLGGSISFGGGAAPTFTLRRVE